MATKPLRYHLRFQIIPGKNVERDARILAKFCKDHGVEEVVLFFAAEEWFNGMFPKKEEDAWFDALRRTKPIMDKAGIVCSLNPWMTVVHGDRGRTFSKDRNFKPMVMEDGQVGKTIASFADPAWQKYIRKLYGRFATLGFRVIWVEDDFRFHNHVPGTWGGGFEPEVLALVAKKIGCTVTREELIRNVLKPGKPHPWRAKLMDTWRELQLQAAQNMAEAVAENSPCESRLGLMSSYPSTHSTEGRDWHTLFDALSIDGRVAHRPHYAGYQEWTGRAQTLCFTMLDIQRDLRPASAEVAPEIENYPYTRWSKSDSLTWAQMAACMFYGSDALLLNIFPFCGNPVDRDPQVGEMLDRSRPSLEWISNRFTKELQTCGVGAPWREDAQSHVQTKAGTSMNELDADPLQPGEFLLPYGIPVSMRTQQTNALFGSLAWAFSDDEIRHMLAGGLMLDGESAEVLCKRGFGAEIGVEFRKWLHREESTYSLEMIVAPETGVPRGHYSSVNLCDRIAAIEPVSGAKEWSTVITPDPKRVGACVVAYRNKLGGRVVTFAVPQPKQTIYPLSYQRQALVQNAARFIAGGKFESPLVTGGAYLMPVHFRSQQRSVLVVFNAATDPARPVITLPHGFHAEAKATLLAPLAKPAGVQMTAAKQKDATVLTPSKDVPYLGYLVVEFPALTVKEQR